jgi:tetraacyldisaccharide 4'-kinase
LSSRLAAWLENAWYTGRPRLWPLYPLAAVTATVARRRLRRFRKQQTVPPVPVIVVGNITVGGTGKTPLVIALCKHFQARGRRVAVISRGYGGKAPQYPFFVGADTDAALSGDEPALIARATGAPVMVDPKRARALEAVLAQHQPDIVISDDGLQHYALPRTAEILVLDALRGLGNGRCLPAGPLREPRQRLEQVDWIVANGAETTEDGRVPMALEAEGFHNPVTGEALPARDFVERFPVVTAVAGIGHPRRFFDTLRGLGLTVHERPLPDHHRFVAADLGASENECLVMTEKDAIKCQGLMHERCWVLAVSARLPESFWRALEQTLAPEQEQ